MRCLIIDDDLMSQAMLREICERIEGISVERVCSNALEAINHLRKELIDFILLDIEMPTMSGFELIKNSGHLPPVIITSSKQEYAMEAFDYNVVDYLQKPILPQRLLKAIERVELRKKENVEHVEEIYVRADGRLVRLHLQDIIYIESLGDYVIFHTSKKEKIIAHSTMKNIEMKIRHPRFVRVHRSFIINLSKVIDIQDTNLIIADRVIPISRAHRITLFNLIQTI